MICALILHIKTCFHSAVAYRFAQAVIAILQQAVKMVTFHGSSHDRQLPFAAMP